MIAGSSGGHILPALTYINNLSRIKYPNNILIPKQKKVENKLEIKERYELTDITHILNDLNSVIEDEEDYIEIFEDIDILNYTFKKYDIDRLSVEQKIPLLYVILMGINKDEELYDILSYDTILHEMISYEMLSCHMIALSYDMIPVPSHDMISPP